MTQTRAVEEALDRQTDDADDVLVASSSAPGFATFDRHSNISELEEYDHLSD